MLAGDERGEDDEDDGDHVVEHLEQADLGEDPERSQIRQSSRPWGTTPTRHDVGGLNVIGMVCEK